MCFIKSLTIVGGYYIAYSYRVAFSVFLESRAIFETTLCLIFSSRTSYTHIFFIRFRNRNDIGKPSHFWYRRRDAKLLD